MEVKKIKEILNNYFKQQPVQKAYLFGSYARGQEDEKSDIDILVELDYHTGIAREFIRMVKDLKQIFNKDIHLVTTKSISPFIADSVNKDKILIYER